MTRLQRITLQMQEDLNKFRWKHPEKAEQIEKSQKLIDELNLIASTNTGIELNHLTFQNQLNEKQFYINELIKTDPVL